MSELTDIDWDEAEARLKQLRIMYTEIGGAGLFGLTCVLNPLLMRFEKGERTQKLYDEIMETK